MACRWAACQVRYVRCVRCVLLAAAKLAELQAACLACVGHLAALLAKLFQLSQGQSRKLRRSALHPTEPQSHPFGLQTSKACGPLTALVCI